MSPYANPVQYGGETINIITIARRKVSPTTKQKEGTTLKKLPRPGATTKDWEIIISGFMVAGTKDADRTNLEALDNGDKHSYTDGLIGGDFIIEDLQFTDNSRQDAYFYRMRLIQFNQTA